MLLFALILLIIGWYLKQNINKLEVVFTKNNEQNLRAFSFSFIFLGIIGVLLGIFIPTKEATLFFVSVVLIVSATFSIRLSKKMK